MSETDTKPETRDEAGKKSRIGSRLCDRPEFKSKPKPLTFKRDALVSEAIAAMAARDFGSVVIVDADNRVEGVLTERDVLKRIVNEGVDPKQTKLEDVMTKDPRTARETDDMVDWLRMMSNERFRRLPVVDEDGKLLQVLTQGDFVSYTWPDLLFQATQLGKATFLRNFQPSVMVAGVVIYPIILLAVFGLIAR